MTDLTELGARALYELEKSGPFRSLLFGDPPASYEEVAEPCKEEWRKKVRAILAALDAAGYQIVPKEPTVEMQAAAIRPHGDVAFYDEIYRAMLAAAPKIGN